MVEQKQNATTEAKKKPADASGEGNVPDVYTIVIHCGCDGCAREVKKIKGCYGVESLYLEPGSSELRVLVFGKVDPAKIMQRLKEKIKQKIEITKEDTGAGGGDKKADVEPEEKRKKKKEEKKHEKKGKRKAPPKEGKVALSANLKCNEEVVAPKNDKEIQKITLKIEGVQSVPIEAVEDLVTVERTMVVEEPPSDPKEKRKCDLEVAPHKKGEGAGDKKDKDGGGGEKNEKEDATEDAGGEKNEGGGGDAHVPTYCYPWQAYGHGYSSSYVNQGLTIMVTNYAGPNHGGNVNQGYALDSCKQIHAPRVLSYETECCEKTLKMNGDCKKGDSNVNKEISQGERSKF